MSFSVRDRRRVAMEFDPKKGLTEQHHKDRVNIHTIMRKYEKTGILEHVSQYKGEYMNLAGRPEFHEAMNIIAEAQQMFETVPAEIRKKFGNDPAEYVEFMQNPENRDKIEALGLDASHLPKPPEPVPEPTPEPVVDPT